MDVQCKGNAEGFKRTEVLITSLDVIGACTSRSKKEKNSQVQARVVAKEHFF